MSPWCWIPRPTEDSVPAAWPVLVAQAWAAQMQKIISCWEHCIQHEGIHAKTPVWPIIVTAPLELLHMLTLTALRLHDGFGINPQTWWTFWSFVTILWEHIMAYVTPNQTAKNVATVSMARLHLRSSEQRPQLLSDWGASFESNILQRALWAYRHMRRLGLHLTMLKPMAR